MIKKNTVYKAEIRPKNMFVFSTQFFKAIIMETFLKILFNLHLFPSKLRTLSNTINTISNMIHLLDHQVPVFFSNQKTYLPTLFFKTMLPETNTFLGGLMWFPNLSLRIKLILSLLIPSHHFFIYNYNL